MLTSRKFKVVGMIVAGLVFAGGGVWNFQAPSTKARAEEVKDDKLKQLQLERLTALRDVAASAKGLFLNARIQMDQVREANRELYEAELELCETADERIKVLENMLKSAQEIEERAKALKVGAQGTEMNVLRVKADRLQIEILLHRAKSK